MEKINWGIIGTGNIAHSVLPALQSLEKANVVACAARKIEKAHEFAAEFKINRAYGSYDELLSDADVQIVYIATPHMNHFELSKKALEAGKAVVVEKPSCVNKYQLLELIGLSRKKKIFFMEAMWTRFQPTYKRVFELIQAGKIGKIKGFYADFCIDVPYKPGSRIYEMSLAGGALLDVTIYPLMYALSLINFDKSKIQEVKSLCRKTETGVDAADSISIRFSDFTATVTGSIDTECGNHFKSARIVGENGVIHVPHFWYSEEINILDKNGAIIEKEKYPFDVNGYEYEFAEAMKCFGSKEIESKIHPHKDSLLLLEMMDGLRGQWKLVYPFEAGLKVASSSEIVETPEKNILEENVSVDNSISQEKPSKQEAKPEEVKKSVSKNNSPVDNITIYTDGACSGNPGKGGWGAVILANSEEHRLSGGEKITTNNRMELMAAIEALETVAENPLWKNANITLISDSQYVKNGIQSWIHAWKKNGWRTANKEPVKNKDLWLELDEISSELKIRWQWVKGHAGNKYNEICDNLAVSAAKNIK